MTPALASQRLMVLNNGGGPKLMLLSRWRKFAMVVRSGKALSRDNRAKQTRGAISYRASSIAAIAQGCTNAACSECVAWFPADKVAITTSLKGKNGSMTSTMFCHWQNLLHAGQENPLFWSTGAYC